MFLNKIKTIFAISKEEQQNVAMEPSWEETLEQILKTSCEHGECAGFDKILFSNCPRNCICERKKKYMGSYGEEPIPGMLPVLKVFEYAKEKSPYGDYKKFYTKAMELFCDIYCPNIKPFAHCLSENINIYGIRELPFWRLLIDLKEVSLNRSDDAKLVFIHRALRWTEIGEYHIFDREYLPSDTVFFASQSLFDRDQKEFEYAVRFWLAHTDTQWLSSNYEDPSAISLSDIFTPEGVLKPSGIYGEEGDTLYNMVESWN